MLFITVCMSCCLIIHKNSDSVSYSVLTLLNVSHMPVQTRRTFCQPNTGGRFASINTEDLYCMCTSQYNKLLTVFNYMGENTVLQLNILETGVLTLVVQNSSPTRLRLVGDEL